MCLFAQHLHYAGHGELSLPDLFIYCEDINILYTVLYSFAVLRFHFLKDSFMQINLSICLSNDR